MAAMLTNSALQGIREYVKRRVLYARYKIGSTYYKVPLNSITVMSNGIVEITFMIELESGSGVVTEVQLWDTEQQLWLSKPESLAMSDVSAGFLYVIRVKIEEVTS